MLTRRRNAASVTASMGSDFSRWAKCLSRNRGCGSEPKSDCFRWDPDVAMLIMIGSVLSRGLLGRTRMRVNQERGDDAGDDPHSGADHHVFEESLTRHSR